MRDKNLSVECFIDQHKACKKEGCVCYCHFITELLAACKEALIHLDALCHQTNYLAVQTTLRELIARGESRE